MDTIKNILQLWRFYWRTEKKNILEAFLHVLGYIPRQDSCY